MTVLPTFEATLEDEQNYFTHVSEARESKRAARALAAYAGGDRKANVSLRKNASEDATLGDPQSPVAFMRIDQEDDEPIYIGRHGIADADSNFLVLNWQLDSVLRLYEATAENPRGVVRQRRFTVADGNEVTQFDDLVLADLADRIAELDDPTLARVEQDDVLQAALTEDRSAQMRDIVQTIQAAQSALIRTPANCLLVVQGGPGTGKTAVATHRVSWLLYNHTDLAPEDVLVLGPSPTFTKYIDKLFETLGDGHVPRNDVLGMVTTDARATLKEETDAARLKGSEAMDPVLSRGLTDRIKAPSDVTSLRVRNQRWSLTVTPSQLEEWIAPFRVEPYNVGRANFRDRLSRHLDAAARREIHATRGPVPISADPLVEPSQVDLLLDRCWPQLSPQSFLRDLFGSQARLIAAGGNDLRASDLRNLHRNAAPRLSEQRWSKEDLVLLDHVFYLMNGDGEGYKHIIVDEAQDLSPMQLLAIRRRSSNGAFTIVGDIAQSTGLWARSSWDDVIALLRSGAEVVEAELAYGYRVPRKVMEVAGLLLPTIAPHLSLPTIVRDVPRNPVFSSVGTTSDFVGTVVEHVQDLAKRGRFTGIICPDIHRDDVIAELKRRDVQFTDADQGKLGSSINLISPNAAKGLEFDATVIVDPREIVDAGPEGLRMLYIALTRTTNELAILYPEGSLPRPLIDPHATAFTLEEAPGDGPVADAAPEDADPVPSSDTSPPLIDQTAEVDTAPRPGSAAAALRSAHIHEPLSDKQRRTVDRHVEDLLEELNGNVLASLQRHVLEAALERLIGSSAPETTDEGTSPTSTTSTTSSPGAATRADEPTPSDPAAPQVDRPNRPAEPQGDVDLLRMLDAGILAAGEELRGSTDESAVVTASGTVIRAGVSYPGPSDAACAAVGYKRDGWNYWHVLRDETLTPLGALRSRLGGRSTRRYR